MANTDSKGPQPVKVTKEADGTVKAWYRIADLILDENNAREHGDKDLEATGDSIEQFEQLKNIVIDVDGIVRAGNGTCLALLRRGEELVWGVRSKLKGAAAVAYALADNRTAELSKWDYQIVAESLKWLEGEGQDISKLGWADYEIEPLLQAEWRPDAKGDLPGIGDSREESLYAIKVTSLQNVVIQRAINKLRLSEGDNDISEGRALELICADFLA